jgi:hypothetical protein
LEQILLAPFRFLIGIGYDRGICLIEDAPNNMNGQQYADIINDKQFEPCLGRNRTILQDNCPVQNSAIAREAFKNNNIKLFSIPMRSPDINIIENLFHSIKRDLRKQAIDRGIVKESKQQLRQRVCKLLAEYPCKKINKLVDSLPKRVAQLKTTKGNRLKY